MNDHTATAPSSVVADRSAGVVVASAAGDALGAGYEFGPSKPPGAPVGMVGGGAFDWAPGEWTDDTQMALGILEVLAAGSTDVAAVESAFRRWFHSGPADVGVQTSAVLSSTGPLAQAAAHRLAQHPDGSAGNGSLMRTGPVALAHPGDPEAVALLAAELSALTHADDDCIDACVLWSVAIDHTVHHAPRSGERWDWAASFDPGLELLPPSRRARWSALIDEAADAAPIDFPNNGWVVHAFQAALAAICDTPAPADDQPAIHLRHALEHAVRAGGDTDTVAAIAGSLLGARWGATAVPFRWRRILNGRGPDPAPQLRGADLEHLARLARRGGRPDPHGWPGCSSMLDHYRSSFRAEPVAVELDGVLFGNAAGLAEALDAGVDAVVSLCRMGTDDVPHDVEHHVVGLLDTNDADNPNLDLVLCDTVDGIDELVADGRTVFVHCVAAENRTPTLAAAWLHRRGQPVDDALGIAEEHLNRPAPFLCAAIGAASQRGGPVS